MDILSKLKGPEGSKTERRRIGRGVGSGLGKTAGRGQKGQKARSKGQINKLFFEGGQTPLMRRLPKRGFKNPNAKIVAEVNVGSLEQFEPGSTVDIAALQERGLVKGVFDVVKILGEGDLSKKLTVSAHRFSKSAAEKIEKAGGSVATVPLFARREETAPAG
jgi:large subunit ribosomal protein L15